MPSPSSPRRHVAGAGVAGIGLLTATSALPYVHFGAHGGGSDVTLYERYATRVLDGEVPYHGFFFEYPPLSLVALVVPKLSWLDYAVSLRLFMWLLLAVSLVAVLLTLSQVGAGPERLYGAALLIGGSPALLGAILFERFDAWPAALLSISLALLARQRWPSGSVFLALAVCTKLYPVVVAPLAVLRALAAAGSRVATRAATAGVVAAAIVTIPFAAVGLGGLGFSYYVQFKRPLQLEALGASILLGLDRLGLIHTSVDAGLSRDLASSASGAVALASTAVQLAAIAAAAWWFWRGQRDTVSMLTAAAAAVTCFIAFGKVLSPQYLIWLVPLIPLVARGVWRPAMTLTVAALALTGLYFPRHYGGIIFVSGWVWVLLLRNVLLVALALLLLVRLRRDARQWRVQSEKPPNTSRT